MKWHLSTLLLAPALPMLSTWSLFLDVIDIDLPGLLSGELEQLGTFLISCLPRLLTILYTGVDMSVAGLIMQQLCMNKFVSPTTGATTSSAQLGTLLALLFLPNSTLWGRVFSSFVFTVLGIWTSVWFTQCIQFKSVAMVSPVGIMFGNVIDDLTNYLTCQYGMTQALPTRTVGHFSMVFHGRYKLVYLVIPLVTLASLFTSHFNVVDMRKDFSKNLGVPYNLVPFLGLIIAAMTTASVVVVVGSIPYIDLIVPNVVAMFKGDKIHSTLMDVALFDAVFVLGRDMIGWTVIALYELSIELTVGILGSLTFVVLLLCRSHHGRKAIRLTGGGADCGCTPTAHLDGDDAT